MSDLICLSSDDEEPPYKKTKPVRNEEILNKKGKKDNNFKKLDDSIICLDSDEDCDSDDTIEEIKNKHITSEDLIISDEIKSRTKCNNTNILSNGTEENDQKENLNNNDIQKPETTKHSSEKENLPINNIEVVNESSDDTIIKDSDSSSSESSDLQEIPSDTEINLQDESKMEKSDLLENTDDLPEPAKKYLSTCLRVLKNTAADPIHRKIPIIIKMFRSLSGEFSKSQYLNNFLMKQTEVAEESVSCSIVSFTEVYVYLKDLINSQCIDLPKENWKHVRKLEKTMKLLMKKLKELEEAEVDLDDDESAYIKYDRYSQRLGKVHKKYCQILKKNPHAGRITYERLDFVSSAHNEINQAISKTYKNNEKFPSYDELSKLIHKVVEEKDIPLRDVELKLECEMCFKKLGDLLQTRRKRELYEVHQRYLVEEDPAKSNKNLAEKLRISLEQGKSKIDSVCQEFIKKQEKGIKEEEIDLSECEDGEDDEDDDDNVEDSDANEVES